MYTSRTTLDLSIQHLSRQVLDRFIEARAPQGGRRSFYAWSRIGSTSHNVAFGNTTAVVTGYKMPVRTIHAVVAPTVLVTMTLPSSWSPPCAKALQPQKRCLRKLGILWKIEKIINIRTPWTMFLKVYEWCQQRYKRWWRQRRRGYEYRMKN